MRGRAGSGNGIASIRLFPEPSTTAAETPPSLSRSNDEFKVWAETDCADCKRSRDDEENGDELELSAGANVIL